LAAELRALDEEREDAPAPAEHWGSGEENDATGRGGAEFCGRDLVLFKYIAWIKFGTILNRPIDYVRPQQFIHPKLHALDSAVI
jgi:hypothetical protein